MLRRTMSRCENTSRKNMELKSKAWSKNGASCAGIVSSLLKISKNAPSARLQSIVAKNVKLKIGKPIRYAMTCFMDV